MATDDTSRDDTRSEPGLLHHVELYASDLDESAAFWGWFLGDLGYEEHQRWESGRSWKKGPTYVVVVQADDEYLDVPYHRCRPGLNHLAFHAASRAHVDEMTDELRARGVPVLYEDDHPFAGGDDHYAVYVECPERVKVELVAPE
jgi:catechol 2,3-dioxygenase-like lactoylglutathione lyase family enzyme